MWKNFLGSTLTTIGNIVHEPDEAPNDNFFNPPKLPPSPRAALFARKESKDYGEADDDDTTGAIKNVDATPTHSTPKRQDSATRRLNELGQAHRGSCSSLVDTAKCGGMATLLIFEHSQKTSRQTLEAVIPMISNGIFSGLPENHIVKAVCVELCGSRCTDLMDNSPSRVVDNSDGSVRFVNTIGQTCGTPEDLKNWILLAKGRLEARLEAEDDLLPRHMVCRIVIVPPKNAPAHVRQGTLTILDCPAASRKDVTLRACLRAHASGSSEKPPYENSTLTRCLRESLEREDATCQIIESEKSTQSLYAVPDSNEEEQLDKVPLPPKRWDHSTLCEWLVSRHLIEDRDSVRKDLNGKSIMNMSKAELEEVLCSNDSKKADLLYRCLRAETDRVARLELKHRMAINKNRRSR